MIRHPPRSTLFPYPPLSRSLPGNEPGQHVFAEGEIGGGGDAPPCHDHQRADHEPEGDGSEPQPARVVVSRSEEHTSELQSQSNLVCRLLLEKKKNHETLTLA